MNVTMLGLAIGPMGTFYIVTLYLQKVRAFSPLLTGSASALPNSAQQIGVALGLAVLAGVVAAITAGSDSTGPQALVAGYSAALVVGAGVLVATAILALVTSSERD